MQLVFVYGIVGPRVRPKRSARPNGTGLTDRCRCTTQKNDEVLYGRGQERKHIEHTGIVELRGLTSLKLPPWRQHRLSQRSASCRGFAPAMATAIQLDQNACLKILCHGIKPPYGACVGLLLGRRGGGGEGSVRVVDSVPVQHHLVGSSLVFDVAFKLLQPYLKESGLSIVGSYQWNISDHDKSPSPPAIATAQQLVPRDAEPLLLVVDSAKLPKFYEGEGHGIPPFDMYTVSRTGGGELRKQKNEDVKFAQGIHGLIVDLVSEERHETCYDLDDHLDDTSRSWPPKCM